MKIALVGAHRVGKTTLAQKLSDHLSDSLGDGFMPFLKTNTSEIMMDAGYDPSKSFGMKDRLVIQNKILDHASSAWSKSCAFVTDRSPVDYMAYTLAEATPSCEDEHLALSDYMQRCYELLNENFTALVIVPPGIPVVPEPGKGALNECYRTHLHALITGLAQSKEYNGFVFSLSDQETDLEYRLDQMMTVISRIESVMTSDAGSVSFH